MEEEDAGGGERARTLGGEKASVPVSHGRRTKGIRQSHSGSVRMLGSVRSKPHALVIEPPKQLVRWALSLNPFHR